ncbi:Transport of quorum-sensing signal protein [Jannaschia seosinensis]|uniref:Transport of quorum-sensing signal protein n=1 Tax=Jannaschia seosinensis TaxID=313367 RepID=A0A0M7B4W9_9RHOB|nr:AI-2E family transporter [Jannaschia seosinensis]CUH21638.1 Transport of quorum-sensing signal protein [Jannaschia seosinensis]
MSSADSALPEVEVPKLRQEGAVVETPLAAPPVDRQRHPLLIPINGIFGILLVQALIVAAEFLIPVTTALLGYFILNAPRRGLQKIGVPPPVTAAFFTLMLAAILFLGGMALADPIYYFVTDIPDLLSEAAATLTGPGGLLEPFARAAEATEETLENGKPGPMEVEVVGEAGFASSIAAVAPGLLSQIVFAVVLLFFLVSSGDMFIQKAVQAADRFEDKKRTVATIRTIEARLGNYLGAITLINAGLGVAIGIAMFLWGLPSPWLIGLMATVLNFVPFVGAVLGSAIAAVITFVSFSDGWAALGVFLTYYALTSFEGQFVTPTLVGQRLRLNVTAVFLAVAFFAWIWSVMGMVVAVPLLIVVKVVCDTIPKFRKVGMFLGDAEGFVPRNQ